MVNMDKERLNKYKAWFVDYVADYYGDDEFVNANIKLKADHSLRVCDEADYLADQLALEADQSRLAEVIALFHDLGRFPQFIKYRTYNDPKSVNHCLLSLDVLAETNILDGIDNTEKEIIKKAIEFHGIKQLPPGLNGCCLLQSKLIRDADKLDIYRVVIGYYQQHRDDPDGFKLEIELPDEPFCSPEVVNAILNEQLIDYSSLRTWNDMKLIQLDWVYDMNFTQTLKRIRQQEYLEQILEFLPTNETIEKVRKKIFEYIDSRIKQAE